MYIMRRDIKMKKIIAIFLLLGTSIQVFAEVVPSTENKEIKFIKQDREREKW